MTTSSSPARSAASAVWPVLLLAFGFGVSSIRAQASSGPEDRTAPPGPSAVEYSAVIDRPVQESFRRLYPERVSVLQPAFARLSATQWDDLVIYSAGKIEVIDARTGQTSWPGGFACRSQPVLLGRIGDLYVFATAHRLFAVAAGAGWQAWSFGADPPEDPNTDPEATPSWIKHCVTEGRIFSVSDRGQVVCLGSQDGSLRWREDSAGGPAVQLAATDRRLFIAVWAGNTPTLSSYDAETGRLAKTVRLPGGHPAETLIMAPGGVLLVVFGDTILALDDASLLERYRIPAPDRIMLATLQVVPDGLFVGDQSRRVTKYDLAEGQVLWRTPPIGSGGDGPPWVQVWDDRLLVASENVLCAFDAHSGHPLWRRNERLLLDAQPPWLSRDAVIVITPEPHSTPAASQAAAQPTSGPVREAVSYQVRLYSRSGKLLPVIPGGTTLAIGPLESFGGLYVRDDCLAVLDGRRLVGYVARPAASQPGTESR